jgi:hypothetical protein
MGDLNLARADRLAAGLEILESAHAAGQYVDLDSLSMVMAQMLSEVGDGPFTRDMDQEEEVLFLGLAALLVGIQDMLHLIAQRQRPGGYQRVLLDLRRDLWERVIVPRMQLLSEDRQVRLMKRSDGWGYSIWAPGHQLNLLKILKRAQTARGWPKDLQAAAKKLVDHLDPVLPMGSGAAGADPNETNGQTAGQKGA